jgi:hypothetical protein
MSRSYRKPYWVVSHRSGNTRPYKRAAQRRFRYSDTDAGNSVYKRMYCSWDIKDYCVYGCRKYATCEDCWHYHENGYCKVRRK